MLQENKTENRINPFFAPYNTPHDTVPFDRIRLEDYEEAFMEGIRRDDEATDKIVNDPEEPTFENTLARVDTEKGEHYYDLLSRVSNVFSCMMSAETCDEMEALAQKMSPILTKHANDITLNKKLFERIKFVHDHPMMVLYAAVPCSIRKARRSCASSPRRQACSPCSFRRTCSRKTKPSSCISPTRLNSTDCPRLPLLQPSRMPRIRRRKDGSSPSTSLSSLPS